MKCTLTRRDSILKLKSINLVLHCLCRGIIVPWHCKGRKLLQVVLWPVDDRPHSWVSINFCGQLVTLSARPFVSILQGLMAVLKKNDWSKTFGICHALSSGRSRHFYETNRLTFFFHWEGNCIYVTTWWKTRRHGLESPLKGSQYPLKLLRYSRAQDRVTFLGLDARSGRINRFRSQFLEDQSTEITHKSSTNRLADEILIVQSDWPRFAQFKLSSSSNLQKFPYILIQK